MIREFCENIWQYRRAILAAALLSGALGLATAILRPPEYRVTATLDLVPRPGPEGTLGAAEVSAVLQDQAVVGRALQGVSGAPTSPASFVADHLEIQAVPGTRLLRVSVTLPSADAAAASVRSLATEAAAERQRVEAERVAASRAAVEKRLEGAADALAGLVRYRSGVPSRTPEAEVPDAIRKRLDYEAMTRIYARASEEYHEMGLRSAAAPAFDVIAIAPAERAGLSVVQLSLLALVSGFLISLVLAAAVTYVRLAGRVESRVAY